jgi:4-carboxymuconolactone decarboxylase
VTSAGSAAWIDLARFAAGIARHDVADAARAIARLRRAGGPRRAVEETALMVIPNVGYPAGLEALRVLQEGWPGRARATREGGRAAWRRRGRIAARGVYGSVLPRLLSALRVLHPDVATWVVEDGYGRMLSRSGLDPRTRELVAIALLATGGWERQLVSHLLGARRLGAASNVIARALAVGLTGASSATRLAATGAWATAFRKDSATTPRAPRRARAAVPRDAGLRLTLRPSRT